jgi:ribosomal-protein-serine acetyltransferase
VIPGAIDVRVESPGAAEIGYWLAEKAQGRGIVSRAVRVLVRFSFVELGVDAVLIRCARDNVKSRAIPERLGFTLTATLPGQEVRGRDQLVYSLPRSQWESLDG